MFWARIPRPNSALHTAARIGKTIATGSAFALTTTAFSCTLAIVIEGAAHKALYYFKPQWYDGVTYAYGLPQLEERHDPHVVCETGGVAAASVADTNEQMELHQQIRWDENAPLAASEDGFDDTIFTTGFAGERQEQEDCKEERRPLAQALQERADEILSGADKITGHVLSAALTG